MLPKHIAPLIAFLANDQTKWLTSLKKLVKILILWEFLNHLERI